VRIYYDTEFLETADTLARGIDLISIGLVAEDGREYYAITARDDVIHMAFGDSWLSQNVTPHLPITEDESAFDWQWDTTHKDWPAVKPPALIAAEVRDFIVATPDVELWAWYAAYDHVVLCWLWGRMVDLPEGVPMWTNDLRQEVQRLGNPAMPEQAGAEHNALADARHVRDMYAALLAGAP
jgi:hypothetical protein